MARSDNYDVILLRMQPDQEIVDRWTGSAPYWEKHREIIRQMFTPVSEALIEAAQIGKGKTVLDIATGPGEPALRVAAAVGPGGKVIGIDPIPGMVEAARRAADRLEIRNAQFEVAFADQLPFAADTFDAVISRFGVMFFPSPVDGLREMLRVLKPGGKLALAVWHTAETNPFHHAIAQVMDRFVESPPLAPDAPDAFRYATPGKLRKILDEAGTAEVSERLLRFKIEAQVSVEDYWALRVEMSEKLREKIAKLSAEQKTEVRRLGIAALQEYSTEHGVSFPAEVLLLTGGKAMRRA